jgi:orotate phosphoribosyltransferase
MLRIQVNTLSLTRCAGWGRPQAFASETAGLCPTVRSGVLSWLFMPSSRQKLLSLLARNSFRLGNFKLSSGATSDYYIDCRTTTLDAKGSRLTGEVFVEEIRQRGWRPQAIGGLTLGADPIVVAVSVISGELHGFLVRKTEKQHGTGQRIEGFREKGARVVIVDDVCTTGASTVQAIEAAKEFGFEIAGVMCLVEREEANGRPNVEKAAAPAPFVAIFTAKDLRKEHGLHTDDTGPIFAVSAVCEVCGRPAVTNKPRNRCEAHKV